MSYTRVIPRDLFNESNLLKCYGQLYLNLENMGLESSLRHNTDYDETFLITSSEDGCLTIDNVQLVLNDEEIMLECPLNSREPYPLYIADEDFTSVFNDDGTFTEEFRIILMSHQIWL